VRTASVPAWAYVAALAGLAYMTWDRLERLLAQGPPEEVWARVLAGTEGEAWAGAARRSSVEAVAEAHMAAGVRVHLRGQPDYPSALGSDHQAPPALFSMGSMDALHGPSAGVIGTRRATGYGRDVARRLGRELAEAGVAVVSGLALGIDGASHEGALSAQGPSAAPPVGVVGSGFDVVYPRRHVQLWQRVAEEGLLLSETPLGAQPEAWRFPARNRIIAALSRVLVVVESHHCGGSFHTVAAAAERAVPVMAVPGPVTSPASAGTNRLLAEGCAPACDPADVLAALSLETAGPTSGQGQRRAPDSEGALVLDAVGWQPTSTEQVVSRTGLSPPRTALTLSRLEADGWVRPAGDRLGGWWERVGP
jgi:DNA processing protein